LRQDLRSLLAETQEDMLYVLRIFLWYEGSGLWFPNLAKPYPEHPDQWAPSLYAWRAKTQLRWREDIPYHESHIRLDPQRSRRCIYPPYCRLHVSWPDEAEVNRKLAYYRAHPIKKRQPAKHPLDFAGPLEPLPEWGHE
jgi:hypothetical protein